jgi:hypothetical protein
VESSSTTVAYNAGLGGRVERNFFLVLSDDDDDEVEGFTALGYRNADVVLAL